MTEKYPGFFTALFKKREKPVEEPKKKPQKKQKNYDGDIESLKSQIEEIRGMIRKEPEPEQVEDEESVEHVEDA